MAINKVVYGNSTLIDLTEDTVSADKLLAGETAHDRSGAPVVGSVVTAEVIDNLTTQDATKALSANQGYVLKQALDEVADDVEDLKVTEETDTEPYLIRQSKGDMADIELVGGSFAWNQLFPVFSSSVWTTLNCSASYSDGIATFSCTTNGLFGAYAQSAYRKLQANHKYFFSVNVKPSRAGVIQFGLNLTKNVSSTSGYTNLVGLYNCNSQSDTPTIYMQNGVSGTDNFMAKDYVVIDLTQLFGTTIADAIYAMEQATSGSGVAFFRKYFPNTYYAYNGGSIQSVCASERKVSGFNLHDEIYELGMIDSSTGQPAPANATYRTKNFFKVIPSTQYYVYCDASVQYPLRIFRYDANKNYIDSDTYRNALMTVDSNVHYLKFHFNIADLGKNFCINISNPSKNGQYEPYHITTYPLPNAELRGIPTLVDNKLKYDGDTLESNGKVTRKYGIVDLGTLSWTYDTNANYAPRFFSTNIVSLVNKPATGQTQAKIICSKFIATTDSALSNKTSTIDKAMAITPTGWIYIKDTAYTDATTFKNSLSGVYLVYELATPTTEDTSPFQNPQRANKDGIEEFVDYEYDWMQSRDVAIPVGHNTKYIFSEALAYSEDYADGLLKYVENDLIPPKADITALTNYDFSGMTTAPLSISKDDYFYMDGSLCKALVDINQGATLTYNTNYKTCSVATELNELRNKTEWHEVMSGTQTLSTTEDETLMWSEASYNPTYFGCDFFVFSDLAGFYLKDFSYGGHDGSITFPKWSSAVTVKYKIMARGEANQSGSGITTYYNAPILNQ